MADDDLVVLPSDVDEELPPDVMDGDVFGAGPMPSSSSRPKPAAMKRPVMKRPSAIKSIAGTIKKKPAAKSPPERDCHSSLNYLAVNLKGAPSMPTHMKEMIDSLDKPIQPPLDVLAEIFSPPRVMKSIHALGYPATRAMDLKTGWDLTKPDIQEAAMKDLALKSPKVLGLSPPCTYMSQLMHSNWWRMDKSEREKGLNESIKMLDFAVWLATWQHQQSKGFYLEHPQGAKSWSRPNVKELMAKPGVFTCTFDECQFGLVSKEEHTPIQKPTILMTNIPDIHAAFHGKRCHGGHQHVSCQGVEGGVKRSVWAQMYPKMMCDTLASSIISHLKDSFCYLICKGARGFAMRSTRLRDISQSGVIVVVIELS